MRLHPLLAALDNQPAFKRLVDELRSPSTGEARSARLEVPDSHVAQVLSVITPARPYALAAMHAALGGPMLLVAGPPSRARADSNELRPRAPDPDPGRLF